MSKVKYFVCSTEACKYIANTTNHYTAKTYMTEVQRYIFNHTDFELVCMLWLSESYSTMFVEQERQNS